MMQTFANRFFVSLTAAVLCTTVCRGEDSDGPAVAVEVSRLHLQHLPNAIRLHGKVISGGIPDGRAGFRQLAEIGVKTVISVDGLKPDVDLAKQYGLRYVHLPHGYDGIQRQRIRELAKAVHELPGPIYVHCHHGKHRSPAAAVSACITLGLIPPTSGEAILKQAGTSQQYRGLYRSVETSQPVATAKLEGMAAEFHSTVDLPPIIDVMTQMEAITERLERSRRNKWAQTETDPDRTPDHDALLLRELFAELQRDPEIQKQPADYLRFLKSSETDAKQLQEELRRSDINHVSAASRLARIRKSCVACHRAFRN